MTNKDTNPLRERIEKTLNKISGYNYNEYGEEIYSYISGENEATDNLLSLMEDRMKDFDKWKKENNVDTYVVNGEVLYIIGKTGDFNFKQLFSLFITNHYKQ
jgi:hypothetical protein